MWGVCSDPEKEGCSEAVLNAGRVMTIVGGSAISFVATAAICCLKRICCWQNIS